MIVHDLAWRATRAKHRETKFEASVMASPSRQVPLGTTVHAGLYEALLTLATQQELDQLSDPRLYSLAPVDCEDAHSALAQFLEHALASSLASFRGAETAERQKRLVDRIIGALTDELGADWTDNLSISTPLRRLLAVHANPCETPL